MATLTFRLAAGPDWFAECSVNQANWRVSSVRLVNDSDFGVAVVIKKAGVDFFSTVAPAHKETTWNVSGMQLSWEPPYWNSLTETWDEAGLDLGDYEIGTRFPA